jgi:DNA-directed RNA polymerase I subunit RPA12
MAPDLPNQTVSKASAFPSALRAKRSYVQALDHSHVETWATTSEACPVCASSATLFRELQLRGADEGSTVFFRCSNCAHKYANVTPRNIEVSRLLTTCRWKLDN